MLEMHKFIIHVVAREMVGVLMGTNSIYSLLGFSCSQLARHHTLMHMLISLYMIIFT
jgi:hypothetical protein